MAEQLNLTPFCWALERRGDARVDLLLYAAPGASKALHGALPAEWGARPRGRSAVRLATSKGVVAALRALEGSNGPLMALVGAYEELTAGAQRGVSIGPEQEQALRAVCFSLLTETGLAAKVPRGGRRG